MSRAAEIAASKGILVVDAAGNDGNDSWHFIIAPADVNGDSLLAIGAVDQTGTPASFSSYGPNALGMIKPDLAARGVGVPVTAPTGNPQQYFSASGTSFATPLTAGLVACMIQARPSWPPGYIIRALRETASNASTPNNRVGYGIPDGLKALRWQPSTANVPPGFNYLRLHRGPNPMRGWPGHGEFRLDG